MLICRNMQLSSRIWPDGQQYWDEFAYGLGAGSPASAPPVFRLLGPVDIVVEGAAVRLARPQHRDLLALLLLRANRLVTIDQIVDEMWGEAVPATAVAQVQNMVSAIRAAVGRGERRLVVLEWRRCGYLLQVEPNLLDLAIFEGLVTRARAAPTASPRAELLRAALALWRGPPLADVSAAFAVAARTRLEEQRTAAVEAMFDAELDRGRHAEIIAEATDEVARNPYRERLVGQLMVGLYRSGQRVEALRVYRKIHRALAEEHGMGPGATLRELESRILRDDPALSGPASGIGQGRYARPSA
jgi:DNA-binding SARP family transcriptional activator